jgi:hypothetical protein
VNIATAHWYLLFSLAHVLAGADCDAAAAAAAAAATAAAAAVAAAFTELTHMI